MYNNHFCLIGKIQKISFNQAKENLWLNFKVNDNVISDEHVKSFIKDENKPINVKCQLTNIVLYDIETFNTDKAISYANCIYGLSIISGNVIRDITDRE